MISTKGISLPRTSQGTHTLPDEEFIVKYLEEHVDSKSRHPHITALLPAWGQLLAADLYEISELPSDFTCCQQTREVKDPVELTECFVQLGSDCREYKRTTPGFDAALSCGKCRFLLLALITIII